jgi:hypothetical protein
MYPENRFLKGADFNSFYTDLRNSLRKAINAKFILNGLQIYEKAMPIGRDALRRISSYLAKKSSTKSIAARAFIIHVFMAIGRASEGGLFSWDLAFWNEISKFC